MLDCTSARSLSVTPFSGLTESLRASTVNRTAGVEPAAAMVPPAIGRIDPVLVRGRGEQARFSDMNRERTALGVDSLFRLIGTGEYNDRRGQMRNEQPGDANHKICLQCHGQEFETREVWAIRQDPFSLRCRTLGSCRCLCRA
jgi:hypothetical protein